MGGSGAAAKGQKGKGKEGPQNAGVCEACMPYIDHGEEIPLPLLAQLIKFRLLMAKDADQQRRQVEMKVIIFLNNKLFQLLVQFAFTIQLLQY